jgi:hypothetical protein
MMLAGGKWCGWAWNWSEMGSEDKAFRVFGRAFLLGSFTSFGVEQWIMEIYHLGVNKMVTL